MQAFWPVLTVGAPSVRWSRLSGRPFRRMRAGSTCLAATFVGRCRANSDTPPIWRAAATTATPLTFCCNLRVPSVKWCLMAWCYVQDEQLRPLLEMYRQAGRKVFIATNSLWDYTNVVMNFLIDGKVGVERDTEWLRVRSHPVAALRLYQIACHAPTHICGPCVVPASDNSSVWPLQCAARDS